MDADFEGETKLEWSFVWRGTLWAGFRGGRLERVIRECMVQSQSYVLL